MLVIRGYFSYQLSGLRPNKRLEPLLWVDITIENSRNGE